MLLLPKGLSVGLITVCLGLLVALLVLTVRFYSTNDVLPCVYPQEYKRPVQVRVVAGPNKLLGHVLSLTPSTDHPAEVSRALLLPPTHAAATQALWTVTSVQEGNTALFQLSRAHYRLLTTCPQASVLHACDESACPVLAAARDSFLQPFTPCTTSSGATQASAWAWFKLHTPLASNACGYELVDANVNASGGSHRKFITADTATGELQWAASSSGLAFAFVPQPALAVQLW